MTDRSTDQASHQEFVAASQQDGDGSIDENEDFTPNVRVMEVRGEKEVGFLGVEHVQMDEEEKERVHDIYEDIIIALDDVDREYAGADRAWHLGRVLDEFDVSDRDDMTIEDIGRYNTMDDMYPRRLALARCIYEFWPEQGYNPQDSVSALSEFASRALNQGRVEEAHAGYQRLHETGETLRKTDALVWGRITDADIDAIVEELADAYETPERIVESAKRVLLLLDQSPDSVLQAEVKQSLKDHYMKSN